MATNDSFEKGHYEELVGNYTKNYLGKIFYYCLKKTGDSYEAEDLASDITLNVLKSLENGNIPENFSSWTWKIVRNRYARWADRKRIRSESVSGVDIYDYEIADDEELSLDTWIKNEELSLLRRELAFISSDYRNIIVAFYLEDRKIKDIAGALGLPENTVKTKLLRGRQILKEGMNMAREFGIRSYKPEDVSFTNWCSRFGDKGQPWSILKHPMYKNIFLEAHGQAKTAEELSLELGIALPYMESELEYLTEETFLIKEKNKYITSFPIISKEAQINTEKLYKEAAEKIYPLLTDLVERVDKRCKEKGYAYYGNYQSYDEAKWTLLMLAFDLLSLNDSKKIEYPPRPDNGKWEIIGYQNYEHKENIFVGLHGSGEGNFHQYKFYYNDIADMTPSFISEYEAKVLDDIAFNNTDDLDIETADKLAEYGIVRKDGEKYIPEALVFEKGYCEKIAKLFTDNEKKEISDVKSKIYNILLDVAERSRKIFSDDIPAYYKNIKRLADFVSRKGGVGRDSIFTLAVENGWIRYEKNMTKALGAFILK